MLKKVLTIFFIICLVFSLTVPCFAISTDDYLFTFENLLGSETKTLAIGQPIFYFNVVYGHKYYFRCMSDPVQDTGGNSTFQFYFSNTLGDLRYNLTLNNQRDNPVIVTSYGTGELILRYAVYDGIERTFNLKFLLVDLTSLALDNLTVSQAAELFNSFSDDGYFPRGLGTYQNRNLSFDPFLNFYGNVLGHTFDYFGSLASSYSFPFVLITGILAILLVIFVVVFMIKRFTGGKI